MASNPDHTHANGEISTERHRTRENLVHMWFTE